MNQENAAPVAADAGTSAEHHEKKDFLLFWACFIALIATAFGFIIRALTLGDIGAEFNLTETQKGELFGVGLWPFAISIVLFSLVIDKIGYGRAMIFAFVCHVGSTVMTIFTKQIATSLNMEPYWVLYIAMFIVALGNGTVEAVINPVVATMFSKEKTKWLNILHAGWPGGLVLGGLLTLALAPTGVFGKMAEGGIGWEMNFALLFIPVVIYGLMMIPCKWPVQERVAAGVSYLDMLKEAGLIGALIVVTLIVREIGRVFAWSLTLQVIVGAVLVIGYGLYVKSLGRWLFVFLLLVMIPLATTELGTDSWITDLMGPAMEKLGLEAGWVLVYTSFIMMVLRFFAGPIVHKLSPLGLLAACSLIAACGLVFLSKATGMAILVAATLYGIGKTFFWPTMLGVVAEQFPKGGALTLNTIGGVGMLGVGVVGAVLLGNIQDKEVDAKLFSAQPEIHAQVAGEEQTSVFGSYRPIDAEKVQELPDEQQEEITEIQATAKKSALQTVAIFPLIMFVCYIVMLGYFKTKGGYKPVELSN